MGHIDKVEYKVSFAMPRFFIGVGVELDAIALFYQHF